MERIFTRETRNGVSTIFASMSILALLAIAGCSCKTGWQNAGRIEKNIKAPQFANRDFNIRDFGAIADGNANCSNAINNAIKAASKAGGGRVVVPAGTFASGAIYLKSNVNLHLSEGAVIKFSTDPNQYLPAVRTRWEGVECMNYSPLVYAFGEKNIAITGKGTLDGQGSFSNWWKWKFGPDVKDRTKLFEQGQAGIPVEQRIYAGGKLRPAMIQPYECKNILIEGVTILNAPFWVIHPVLSSNITVRNVRLESLGPNNDGCDPDSCRDVLIEGCVFNTGDDCMAIKSGRNNDGRRVNVPNENVIVRNCIMKAGHGGVVIGSEISAGSRNVFVENCVMDSPDLTRAVRLKSNSARGGCIEDVYVRNIAIGEVSESVIMVDCFYSVDKEKGPFLPAVRNINLENMTCKKSMYVFHMNGIKELPIKDIKLKNCNFDGNSKGNVIKNVENLVMENVAINGKEVSTNGETIKK